MKIDNSIREIIKILVPPQKKLTERVVEIPFLFDSLPEPILKNGTPLKILDVGCCESNIIGKLGEIGFNTHGIDLRNYPRPLKNFIKCDARKMKFPNNTFDVCCAISTLEHIGLVKTPYHTDKVIDKDGDKKALNEMMRVTKKEGGIIITLPYGISNPTLNNWERFYNKSKIEELLPNNLIVDKIKYSIKIGNKWKETDEKTASKILLHTHANGNVCISGHKN